MGAWQPPLATWVHDWDPFIIEFHDGVGLRWYGMAYLVGIVLGYLLLRRWVRRDRLPLRENWLADAALYIGLAMIVGGRLGYCIFYDPSLFGFTFESTFPWGFPYWDVLRVWKGGMASHGGIAGLFVGTWLFCRKYRVHLLVLCDAVAVGATIGVICGRLANFINGELWGRPTTVAWACKFPDAFLQDLHYRLAAGDLEPGRFMALRNAYLEIQPHTARMTAFIAEHGLARHPSQLYAAVFEGLLPLGIGILVHARHRRPGLSMATVLMVYAVGRFIDEFFRQPDAGYELYFGWMSKGQLLSLPLLLVGLGLAVWTLRRPPRPEWYRLGEDAPPVKRG